ncbi:S-adenosyl-L-methionine-dependent methyltransferase, partial [Saccharata proteae CBS 121410]
STRSLRSTDLTHIAENGRTYPNDTYFMPCDNLEQTRLEIMHRVFLTALNGALTTAPIGPGIKRMLDVGTGPGEWASQMAEQYPDAEVVAVDLAKYPPDHDSLADAPSPSPYLSPGHSDAPSNTPPTSSWAFSTPFDLIHIRYMKGAFTSWDAVYAECHAALLPGGILEVIDLTLDTATISPTSSLHALITAVHRAALRSGRPLTLAHLSRHRFEAAGFVDVQRRVEELPMGTWREGERERVLGKMWLVACVEGVEAVALRLLTRWAGWGVDEVRLCCARAREELL